MLTKRVITSLWGIPLVAVAIWFDQPLPWFTILVAIVGLVAAYEFYQMVAATKVPPLTYFGLIGTLLFILSPLYELLRPFILTLIVILPLILLLARRQKEQAFASWAWTVAGILYIGWLLSHLVALRGLEDGRNWVFFVFLITFASDTSAFFVGRALGRHRLAPQISPAKTWEGAIAGVIGAMIFSQFFILPTPLVLPLIWWQAVLLGLAVSIFGQLGDLVESLSKRNMETKETGRLFPGHGGALDRLDSILFAGIVVYYYYVIWVI
jgi:phosphatidate cytidylyltransferase